MQLPSLPKIETLMGYVQGHFQAVRRNARQHFDCAKLDSLKVTRMSHSEEVLKAYSKLIIYLLRDGRLHSVVRSAIILRIGQVRGSDHELHQHVSVARSAGMTAEALELIKKWEDWGLPQPMQAAMRLAEGIKSASGANAETIKGPTVRFDGVDIVEIEITSGYYIMTADQLLSFDIEIEDTAPLANSPAGK